MVNVGKYTIHGWYGNIFIYIYVNHYAESFRHVFCRRFDPTPGPTRSWKWVGDINALFGGDGVWEAQQMVGRFPRR